MNRLRERGVLIAAGNVLQVRPPLVLNEDDCALFLTRLTDVAVGYAF